MTTPRTPPTQNKKEIPKLDPGKQRGLYDTPDLREKILKWQTPPKSPSPMVEKRKPSEKIVLEPSDHTSDKMPMPEISKDKDMEVELVEEPKSTPHVPIVVVEDEATLEHDLRAASAPKKRVVSDEHWKKGRSPTANKAALSPKPTTPVKGVEHDVYMRPGSNKYDAWVRRKSTPAKVSTTPNKVTASPGPSRRKSSLPKEAPVATKVPIPGQTVKEENSGVQELASAQMKTTPTMQKTTVQNRIISSAEIVVVNSKCPKSASPTPRKLSQEDKKLQNPSPSPLHTKSSATPKSSEGRTKLPAHITTRTSSADVPQDDEEIAAQVAGLRVDAWLTNTPDPFVDDGDFDWSDAEISSPIEVANMAHVVKPLSIKVRRIETHKKDIRRDRGEDTARERENTFHGRKRSTKRNPDIRDAYQKHEKDVDYFIPDHNRNRDRPHSDDDASEVSNPTTPTLKRSKATRKMVSPRRQARMRSESVTESMISDAATNASTSFENSTFDSRTAWTNDENASPWYRDRVKNHGNRLTTIASVETISTLMQDDLYKGKHSKSAERSCPIRTSPPDSIAAEPSDAESKRRPRMARKMTSHADLISVLSMADEDTEFFPKSNTATSCRSKLGHTNLTDLMNDLKSEETKYLRELRTMVDGVVPVLLNCVVSKSSSAIAAGLFNDGKNDANATTLIMNIGVALERLKSAHQRMPTSSSEALLMWSQGSYRIYADYLQAWRMGFQDIIVNLAPVDKINIANEKTPGSVPRTPPLIRDGYIVNGDGGKVDVAYLLKRPLVRLKYIARTLKNLDNLAHSEQTALWASNYQELVEEARRRQDEERARLEDQAASGIDATRAREPQTLASLAGVQINPSRCVRARDFFTLKLQHSSGQRIDCGVELLLRDNTPELGEGGDVLICEVDSTSKWLLFPPVQLSQISARPGDRDDELVGMIRGQDTNGLEWYELLTLKAGNPLISHEWIQLLGSKPVPPPSVQADHSMAKKDSNQASFGRALVLADPDRARSPNQIVADVPIGEKADEKAKQWRSQSAMIPEALKQSTSHLGVDYFEDEYMPQKPVSMPGSPTASQVSHSWRHNFGPSLGSSNTSGTSPLPTRNMLHPSRSPLPSPPPLSTNQNGPYRKQGSTQSPHQKRSGSPTRPSTSRSNSYTVWHPQEDRISDNSDDEHQHNGTNRSSTQRPGMERRISNTPNEALPHIPRVRMMSPNQDSRGHEISGTPQSTQSQSNRYGTPPHQSSRSSAHSPSFVKNSSSLPSTPVSSTQRRSSSPLKREYLPSSDSDSSSAMGDIQSDDDESITSDSSADDMFSHSQMPAGLFKPRVPSGSVYSPRNPETLTPSQSASQGPYRTVPPQEKSGLKMIASLFCWSEKGCWESIYPDECSVVVGPGLIEAFEMSAAHSSPNAGGQHTDGAKPLVALELTPLVPLRRGTALDISIRSPPTANSRFRAGNNIMFRSRTGQECEILYGHINQARINNPTYIALQNARGPFGGGTWSSYMDQRASLRNHSAWWRFGSKKSSYRKTNTRRSGNNSSAGQTESSVGTISGGNNTGMSALRRISAGSKVFNVAKSTVTSRGRISGSSTTFTSSSGNSSTPDATRPAPAGLTNSLRIRLYLRETASKWRDMGAARLTIMQPHAAGTMLSQQKRILITGKTRGETLLDVVLGESSFERVARTGIAVNIWEEMRGPNGEVGVVAKTGGVVGGKGRVFMIQMKSEAETAYAFSLVGRLRY